MLKRLLILIALIALLFNCASTSKTGSTCKRRTRVRKYSQRDIREMSLRRIIIDAQYAMDKNEWDYALTLIKEGLIMYPDSEMMFMLLVRYKRVYDQKVN